MTSTVMTPDQRRNIMFAQPLGEPSRVFARDAGGGTQVLVIENKPVFRSGTFADSRGDVHEWEEIHMQQMVDHFDLLKAKNIFSDWPVRKFHPDLGDPFFGGGSRNPMDEMVGLLTGLKTESRVNPADGVSYTYLLATYEILDPDAVTKVQSGLWKNVSAEIGTFVTNNQAEYWPVFKGFAYVDIPAVEGLLEHSRSSNQYSLIPEENMAPTHPGAQVTPPTGDTSLHGIAQALNITDEQVAEYARRGAQAPFAFSINGEQVTDHAKVQNHINELHSRNEVLETSAREAGEAAREDFVTACIEGNKLNAAQKDEWVTYAKSMDDEAFGVWRGLMDGAPAMSITAKQGAGFSHPGAPAAPGAPSTPAPGEQSDEEREIETLKGIVAQHSNRNWSPDKIKATGSYARLVELEPTFKL